MGYLIPKTGSNTKEELLIIRYEYGSD